MSQYRLRPGLGATSYSSQIQSMIPTYCPSCPSSLVLSLVQTESSGNPSAVSPAGAIGLFQLMPSTAAGLNVNPNDPTQNIQGGLTYLQQLYNTYGNWTDALEAYNEGPGALNAQLAAGSTPVSAGYASGILSAAGITDDTGTSYSSISDSLSSAFGGATSSLSDSMASIDAETFPGASYLLVGVGIMALFLAVKSSL